MAATSQGLVMTQNPNPPHSANSGHHVLVIEDEPQMRTMLTDNLTFDVYRVTAVESGEEALRECELQAFSLLLIDVMLPGMSGFELCRRLRDGGTRVPIILLTARTHELDRIHAAAGEFVR